MDDLWQGKCGSNLQPLTMSLASSSKFQLHPQESRNQVLDAGYQFYPMFMQGPSPSVNEMSLGPTFPCTSNISSYNPSHAEPGGSLLSLLSGPPSVLQFDLERLSYPRPYISTNNSPISYSSAIVSAAGCEVSCAPTPLLSPNPDKGNLDIGFHHRPVFASKAVENAFCGTASCLHDFRQARNINLQIPIHQSFSDNNYVNGLHSRKGEWLAGPSPAQVVKHHRTNIQTTNKVVLETNSSGPRQSSPFTSGSPRVYCLGASGDLLLSNTGLLGVVCSCHSLHMSISKFSEHSGLRDVNPGIGIHMDSGETIAQWRKVYFHKFGIRVPEDHSGWDWPEGFSAAAGSMTCSATVPKMSRISEVSNFSGPAGLSLASGQALNNIVCSNDTYTDLRSANEVLHNEKQRNAADSWNFLNGFVGISDNYVNTLANKQIVECPMSDCSTMSKLVGLRSPDNDSQSISTYIGSILKSGNSYVSLSNLQNLKTPSKDSDIFRYNNMKNGDIFDGATVSSNIELRLGQPSQQSHTLGNSNLPAFGSHVIGIHDHPQKSLVPEQPIYNRNMDGRQHFPCTADTAKSIIRRERSQLNLLNRACGVAGAADAYRTEELKADLARGSLISMLYSHLESPPQGEDPSKATNNAVNKDQFIRGNPLCESHTGKSDWKDSPWDKGNRTKIRCNSNELGIHKHVDKGKEVGCATDGTSFVTVSNLGYPYNHNGNLSSSRAFASEADRYTSPAVHDKSSYPFQLSNMTTNASDVREPLNYLGKTSCVARSGHLDQSVPGPIYSPIDAGPILSSNAVSMGISSTISVAPNLTPSMLNKDGTGASPYMHGSLRMFALRDTLEVPNQDCANASFGRNQEKSRLNNSCDVNSKNRIVSKPQNSGVSYLMGENNEKLAPIADLSKWRDYSTNPQGILLPTPNTPTRWEVSRDPPLNKQPFLRLGRADSNFTPAHEQGKCCQRVPYAYCLDNGSCAVHTHCLGGTCDFQGKTSGASREQKAAIGGRTSMLLASRFDEDYTLSKVREISIGQSGELNREPLKKVEFHAFQWRDVPTKVTGTCNMPCTDQLTSLLDDQGNADDQSAATSAAKCFNGDALDAESLKEQEMSNVSSGCSAPAITQASVKVGNEDSCTVDVQDDRFLNNIIVDEGSGIDKCWSSDDASYSERSEFHGFARSIDEGSSKAFSNLTSGSLIDEIRLRDSLRLKRGRNQSHPGFNIHENTKQKQNLERGFKTQEKRKAMFPASGFSADDDEFAECSASAERYSHSSRNIQMSLRPDLGKSHNCACSVGRTSKQKRCSLSFSKTIYSKSDLHTLHRTKVEGVDCGMVHNDYPEFPEASRGKRFRLDQAAPTNKCFRLQEPDCTDAKIPEKCNSMNCMITSSCLPTSVRKRKATPIVGGKYGVISNGDTSKLAKVLSLTKILKRARRCTITENEESKLTSTNKSILKRVRGTSAPFGKFNQKEKRKRESQNAAFNSGLCRTNSMEETFVESNNRRETCILEKETDEGHGKKYGIPDSCPYTRLKLKSMEVLKRTSYALTKRGKDTTSSEFAAMKNPGCVLQKKSRGNLPKFAEESKIRGSESYNGNRLEKHRCQPFLDLDAFCCVCGSSNEDEVNCLLECNQCLIRVHQACYGVSKVPKVHWYCRPCRTSSKDTVCVLCGYGGGAMTQALRSNSIVKTLLKAWDFEEEREMPIAPADTVDKQLNMMTFSGSEFLGNSHPTIKPAHIKSNSVAVWKLDLQLLDSAKGSSFAANNSTVHNSITAGIFDSTVKQWVHMVCGLWTPGTRCPNVDTMSAFDVSGVSCPKVNMVCSMCNRPGGACIQCRAANCSVLFHPWCAHRKGLLQSEVEGFDDECVGFYGRCDFHATHHQCNSDANPCNTKPDHPGEEELTCARTEGYKGRKREGFRHNIPPQSDGTGGCLVSQEQLNAWLHIHGQKLCTKGLPKLPALEVEYDCRKEYARYKQSKGWKHLVVYKSGIHALGLYTSRFIPRGAMVVEYVGEIVGLRVSDKRENEYQSGQKLQYKSACYFFKIDKEHIIDATRKGGIARFVNHSCMPNCVAKVITVRNEKKVVFFAERDVYPGEEITYDYHFNHEDEGEKIPCSCNSKNCRRSLN